jgi:hypothetical protein
MTLADTRVTAHSVLSNKIFALCAPHLREQNPHRKTRYSEISFECVRSVWRMVEFNIKIDNDLLRPNHFTSILHNDHVIR